MTPTKRPVALRKGKPNLKPLIINMKELPSGSIIWNVTYYIGDGAPITGALIFYPCGTKRFISNSWYVDIDTNNL